MAKKPIASSASRIAHAVSTLAPAQPPAEWAQIDGRNVAWRMIASMVVFAPFQRRARVFQIRSQGNTA
jgi:hypothetical protein